MAGQNSRGQRGPPGLPGPGFKVGAIGHLGDDSAGLGPESAGGPELLTRVWEDPTNLPDLTEIREPDLWLGRVAPETHAAP